MRNRSRLNIATAPRVDLDHHKLMNEFFFVVCHHQCHSATATAASSRLEHP